MVVGTIRAPARLMLAEPGAVRDARARAAKGSTDILDQHDEDIVASCRCGWSLSVCDALKAVSSLGCRCNPLHYGPVPCRERAAIASGSHRTVNEILPGGSG